MSPLSRPAGLLLVMCAACLAAAVGATDPYGEISQKLDQIIGEQSAAEHRAASRTVRLDDIAARLDNLTSALDALQQQVDRASTLLPCPVGWRRIGTSCYIISSEEAWVSDAERACDRLAPGAHLASVHAESQQGINDMIASSDRPGVWIGLQRAGDTWAWSDGSVLDVTNWSPGQPDNSGGDEDCGYWRSDTVKPQEKKWNDYSCDSDGFYLCQLDILI